MVPKQRLVVKEQLCTVVKVIMGCSLAPKVRPIGKQDESWKWKNLLHHEDEESDQYWRSTIEFHQVSNLTVLNHYNIKYNKATLIDYIKSHATTLRDNKGVNNVDNTYIKIDFLSVKHTLWADNCTPPKRCTIIFEGWNPNPSQTCAQAFSGAELVTAVPVSLHQLLYFLRQTQTNEFLFQLKHFLWGEKVEEWKLTFQ